MAKVLKAPKVPAVVKAPKAGAAAKAPSAAKPPPKKRDPIKTARNKKIEEMKQELRALLPTVLKETGFKDEASLNAKIGGKADEFIDLKNDVIHAPLDYVNAYLEGFEGHLSTTGWNTGFDELYEPARPFRLPCTPLNVGWRSARRTSQAETPFGDPPPFENRRLWSGSSDVKCGF